MMNNIIILLVMNGSLMVDQILQIKIIYGIIIMVEPVEVVNILKSYNVGNNVSSLIL